MKLYVLALSLILASLSTVVTASGNDTIWQIGKPDSSAAEFALAGHHQDYSREFAGGTTCEVGKSDPSKNWAYIQPGPKDESWAGPGDHPYEIFFDLKSVPQNLMALAIGIVAVNPKDPPTLRLRVNETTREYRLQPGSPQASLDNCKTGHGQVLRMYVNPKFLHPGRNVVNIRVIGGSWLIYDYVSLVNADKAPHLAENLSAKSTILFKKQGGSIKQVVRVSLDLYADQPGIKAHIESDKGWKSDQVIKNVPNGLRDLDICIPSAKSEQKLRLTLKIGPETHKATCTVAPEKQWRIYLTPTSHFDYGYNLLQDDVIKLHNQNLENAIDWCAKYPGYVWDMEGAFLAQEYLKKGSRPDKLIELAKNRRIGVTGFFDNHLTGMCNGDEFSNLIYEYDYLRRTYGFASKFAMETDIPTVVATLPMILREHGIKYFSHGINFTRTHPGQDMIQTPFYWESPDGSRVLTWNARGYGQSDISDIGKGSNGELAVDRARELLSHYISRKDYPFDAILLHGGYGDNNGNSESLPRAVEAWNRTYEYPKIICCRGSEFFEYIESRFSKDIKTVKGDGGVYWEDGVGSSPKETAISRTAKERLLTAQKLIALSNEDFQRQMKDKLADAWKHVLLFDEHTWGADVSISHPEAQKTIDEWAVKKGFADRAAQLADELLAASVDHLSSQVSASGKSVLVFNPSSWIRSETVDFTAPDGARMSVYADSVPGLGYKAIPISSAAAAEPIAAAGNTLENKFYRIIFDETTGAVRSIYDKELGRELVDSSTYGLNSYLYVTGTAYDSIVMDYFGKKNMSLKIDTCAKPSFEKSSLSDRLVMRIKSSAPMANSFSSEVVLYTRQKRIDFINNLDKVETLNFEAGYFAFPFAFKNPRVRVEIPAGVITPDKDQIPGACRDWYCAQHFVSLSDEDASVVWTAPDSPLLTLQDINRGHWYDRLNMENGNLFAYVFNNYWFTNYKASQGGPLTFRFSMTSGKPMNDLSAKRFGEMVQSPMVCKFIEGNNGGASASSASLVSLNSEGVVIQSLEPARFTGGTVIHLREMNGKSTFARIAANGIKFTHAYECNLAEDKLRELPVKNGVIEVKCRSLGITSILLER